MKCNKSRFSKLKLEFDILKMKAAYIEAERQIINDTTATGWQKMDESQYVIATESSSPESFHVGKKSFRDVEIMAIEAELAAMEEQGRKLLKEEKYELMRELQEVYNKIKKDLNRFKNGF